MEPNMDVIRRHQNLIGLPGLPSIESLQLSGDTITIYFRSAIENLPSDPQVVISEPVLPNAPPPADQYTSEHGYLGARTLNIVDGVAPIIVAAIYYPSLTEAGTGGVFGDTLAVTFNKYAALANACSGMIVPFVFSHSGGTYELQLQYEGHDGNTIYFSVRGMTGQNVVSIPAAGDSIRIRVGDGDVMNVFSFTQDNPNNKAAVLQVRYPDLDYVLKAGPSPFKEDLRIRITVEPHLPAVFDMLNPRIRIFDRLGNVAAASGENLKVEVDGASYLIIWDGRNLKGRRAATGTYLLHVIVTDQTGDKKTLKRKVYLYRD
jgi:hypothetical protein